MTLRVRTVPVPDEGDLLAVVPTDAAFLWVRHGEGLVGWGEAVRVPVGTGPDREARASRALADLARDADVDDRVGVPGGGLVAFGSLTFDVDAAASVLVVPRVVHGRREGRRWRTTIDPVGDAVPAPIDDAHATGGTADGAGEGAADGARAAADTAATDRPRFAGSSVPDATWLEAVARAVGRISVGELAKVVLARDHLLWARTPFRARTVAARLADRFPSCHTFLVDGLVGATPELLVAREGDRVRSLVLAGTAARSSDPDDDAALGRALLASPKDRGEHALAVSSVTEVLGSRCTDLVHDAEPHLLRLENVQHLATAVTARLTDAVPSLVLAGALHPTAAVGGVPRERALATIAELEGMDRGRYAAPVGWTAPDGDGEWGIALRCAALAGDRARLFAGAGIVADSRPEDELLETQLKLRAMRSVLGDS